MPESPLVWSGSLVLAAWLLTYLTHSALLICGAELATRRLKGAPVLRDLIWRVALVGGMVTATLQVTVSIADPFETAWSHTEVTAPIRQSATGWLREPAVVPRTPMLRIAPEWASLVVWLWMLGAGMGLARLAPGWIRLRRLLRTAEEVDDASLGAALARVVARAGVRRPIRLVCIEGLPTPIAVGGWRICIPPQSLWALRRKEQEGMLAHELAHLIRGDPGWLALAHVLEAVFFLQPLHRLARRRLTEAAEDMADQWTVDQLGGGVDLARCLLEVATWANPPEHLQLVPSMAAYSASLELRVEHLLNVTPAAGPEPGKTARVVGIGIVLLSVGYFAPEARVESGPAFPPPERPTPGREASAGAVPALAPEIAFCWAVNGRPAHPACWITIHTLGGDERVLHASRVEAVSRLGDFRIHEASGLIVRRMEVRAVESSERRSMLMVEVPKDD